MAVDRLTGADGSLFKATCAAVATTSGTMTGGAFYKVATISGTAVFPTGFAVGDIFLGDAAKSLTVGNSAYLLTSVAAADVSSFKIDFKADEIDVTVLQDGVKKFRKGKSEVSGTVEGINFISEMSKVGSFLNRFVKTASATSANVVAALNAQSATDLYGVFYLNDDTTTGEVQTFMVAQIDLFGYSLGASIGNAQSWSSGLRLNGNDPIIYFKTN
jgi:hypothetical protein